MFTTRVQKIKELETNNLKLLSILKTKDRIILLQNEIIEKERMYAL